ncbi:hypothetical protein D4758_10020 [Enterocloster citroniae]|nr:hypothetical protein [Enterocloster citroniae]RGC10924.1 hypothetical protein DWZ14_12160 [Enterocloster citroniae]
MLYRRMKLPGTAFFNPCFAVRTHFRLIKKEFYVRIQEGGRTAVVKGRAGMLSQPENGERLCMIICFQ